jgi:hypothetical protein
MKQEALTMGDHVTATPEEAKYQERLKRVEDAISLREPDRLPVAPFFASVVQRLYDSSYKNLYYDFHKAGEAFLRFYRDYPQCDGHYCSGFTSGRANELAGSTMIDWPGRPGTVVSDYSSHQVIEHEYMLPEEYHELLNDFTGFMIRKYIPRVYSNLKEIGDISFTPTVVLSTGLLKPLYSSEMLRIYETLSQIGKLDAEATAVLLDYTAKLGAMGVPGMFSGVSEVPYDILGDYFRGTVGIMEDLFEYEDEIAAACDMFADQQIAAMQYLRVVPMPVKRIFFPMHKGMDGFMNPAQYEKLYWKPFKKIILALIDMGVTPYLYTEGRYNSRLEQLADVPKGKVIYHFETVDMKEAKRILGGIGCITGNLPVAMMEYGKKQEVIDTCKYLIDTCAPGGGYIFDFNGSLENTKQENLDAMFNTLETY